MRTDGQTDVAKMSISFLLIFLAKDHKIADLDGVRTCDPVFAITYKKHGRQTYVINKFLI